MNDTYKLQDFFNMYIKCDDSKKNDIIAECKQKLPNQTVIIDRIKKVIDGLISLNNNETSLQLFVNKVFDVANDVVNEDLMAAMESQIENVTDKTEMISKINNKYLDIYTLDNYKIGSYSDNFYVSATDIININGNNKKLTSIDENDNTFYNYVIENLLGYSSDELMYATEDGTKYLISTKPLQEKGQGKLVKEDAICSTKEVEYFIDRVTEGLDKEKWVNRILLDLITNQNYRELSLGDGTLNSDSNENNYYVLNGATLKKEVAVESLYKNYYSEIKKISSLILQNYDLIMNTIESVYSSNLNIDKNYLDNLKDNFSLVYEKGRIQESLDEIDTGESIVHIKNENYENNLVRFAESMDLHPSKVRRIEKANEGYASIFALLGGIMIFGVLLAYLMLKL